MMINMICCNPQDVFVGVLTGVFEDGGRLSHSLCSLERCWFKAVKLSKTFSSLRLTRSSKCRCGFRLSSMVFTLFSTCSMCCVRSSIMSSARYFIASSLFSDACNQSFKIGKFDQINARNSRVQDWDT
jgi:hypothetical protein